jgi:hypothetical protein
MIALPPGAETWTEAERELARAVLTGETVVVNVRKAGPHRRLVPWLVAAGLLTYVGHAGTRHSWPRSDFANPFVKMAGDRTTMVTKYRDWLHEHPELLRRVPTELAGRAIGCWCAPQSCHGDILAEEARGAQ